MGLGPIIKSIQPNQGYQKGALVRENRTQTKEQEEDECITDRKKFRITCCFLKKVIVINAALDNVV